MSTTLGERVAAMEVKIEEIKESQQSENEQIKELLETVQALNTQLERYKGFVGGIVLVFSGIGIVIKSWPIISNFFPK